jgi:tetratricopeptide (TPR) repeat protein
MTRATLLAAALLLAAAAPSPPRSAAAPLLDALKSAPTDQQAEALEQQINLVWHTAITPSVQLLEERAMMSLAHQDPKTAIGDLDAAVDLQPDQALLWRLHAEARFANGDTTGAYEDLAQALAREPRCFPALIDLSHFAEARNDYKRALEAWQQLLTIDPKTPHAAGRLDALQRRVSGEPL